MQSEIPVQIEGFEGHRLAVQPAGWFSGPKLLVDGIAIKRQKGRYLLQDDAGNQVEAKLRYIFVDPIPKLEIGRKSIQLVPPLKWYEYVWICFVPILLMLRGGALGGLFACFAVTGSSRVFRSDRAVFLKYLFSAGILVLAVIGYLILAAVFLALVQRMRHS